MSYSKGISWIDDCRIPFVDEKDKSFGITTQKEQNIFGNGNGFIRGEYQLNNQGRFPANILVCDDMLNDGLPSGNNWKKNYGSIDYKGLNYTSSTNQCIHGGGYTGNNTYADKGSSSRYYDIDKWFDKILND